MECAHRLHTDCAQQMMTAMNLVDVAEIRCPQCRHGGCTLPPVSPTPSELDAIVETDNPRQGIEAAWDAAGGVTLVLALQVVVERVTLLWMLLVVMERVALLWALTAAIQSMC